MSHAAHQGFDLPLPCYMTRRGSRPVQRAGVRDSELNLSGQGMHRQKILVLSVMKVISLRPAAETGHRSALAYLPSSVWGASIRMSNIGSDTFFFGVESQQRFETKKK